MKDTALEQPLEEYKQALIQVLRQDSNSCFGKELGLVSDEDSIRAQKILELDDVLRYHPDHHRRFVQKTFRVHSTDKDVELRNMVLEEHGFDIDPDMGLQRRVVVIDYYPGNHARSLEVNIIYLYRRLKDTTRIMIPNGVLFLGKFVSFSRYEVLTDSDKKRVDEFIDHYSS